MTAALESNRRHHLLILILGICYLLSAALVVPDTRSIESIEAYSSIPDSAEIQVYRRRRSMGESYVLDGRMDIEVSDYQGPGANPGHEPPGFTPTTKGWSMLLSLLPPSIFEKLPFSESGLLQ